jgi:hypothetical protein
MEGLWSAIKSMKKKMLTKILIFLVLSVISYGQSSYGQGNTCSKPKVAVSRHSNWDEDALVKYLNEKYPSQPRGSWLYQIEEKVLAELRMNSPDVVFIPGSGAEAQECDYRFWYVLSLYMGGEDIEISGIKEAEYTTFKMDSKLFQNAACGVSGNTLDNKTIEDDEDLFRTIERNIESYGSIGRRIEEFEESHRVPPRGPEMQISVQEGHVSPVKGERELDIKIEVKNCKGQPALDNTQDKQAVLLPRKTSRGEIKPTEGFPQIAKVTDDQVILMITQPAGVSATYTLKKGMDLGSDPIKIETCGRDKKLIQDVIPPIPIAGMGLEVTPRDVHISPEKSTQIDIELFKVTPQGARQPVPGQSIEVKIEGLVDGSVSPQGKVRTDGGGKAVLTYRAGKKEEGIRIYARYQPEDYPDFIKGSSGVTVVEEGDCWTGTVEVIEEQKYEEHKQTENPRGESSVKSTIDVNNIVQFYRDPRKSEEIMNLDTASSYYYELKKFIQYEAATCRRKVEGRSRDVTVRPGDWHRGELTMTGKLIEKNPKVYVTVSVDRPTNRYTFHFGIEGFRWQGHITGKDTFYNACKGTTRNETNGPTPTVGEQFQIKSLDYEGQTDNPNRVRGIKTIIDKTLGTKVTTFKWNIERIKCKEN